MLNLFKPGRIGKLQIKNRIVMAAMGHRGLIELDGRVSQRLIDYYTARAAGGTGLIITGLTYVDVDVEPHLIGALCPGAPRADLLMYMARFEELANAVHNHGARIAVQLTAGRGRIAPAAEQNAGRAVAPSAIPCFWPPNKIARALTTQEVETLVKDFGISARLLKAVGIDAVELHGHEGYLLDQFATALWNKRTDKYGGDLEGRLRFPLEIIARIKSEAGADFPIIYKFGATHYLEGARDIPESCQMAKRLQEAGVHAFDVDAGCYESSYYAHPPTYMPPGCLMEGVEAIKKVVDIPVIGVGKLGYPDLAESVIRDGRADFVALARPLLADPEWARKVKEGRPEDIRTCIGCHQCSIRLHDGLYLSCAVNPAAGIERELALTPAPENKRVLVIGGGPGGMEAARVAALRGHQVTLWEKTNRLGGNVIPAAVPGFKSDLGLFTDYLVNQIKKLKVQVELNKEATPELVRRMDPQEVIVATGATPRILDCQGAADSNVLTAVDALMGTKKVGKTVVVIGGGEVGCEVAVWLAKQGKKTTVVEILPQVLGEMHFINKWMLEKMLREAGVTILTGSKVVRISDKDVVIQKEAEETALEADTVVLSVGLTAQRSLAESLDNEVKSLHVIGDCVEPREIKSAIWEGYNAARII